MLFNLKIKILHCYRVRNTQYPIIAKSKHHRSEREADRNEWLSMKIVNLNSNSIL